MFDLHNFQYEQTKNIYSTLSKIVKNDPSILTYAGWPLYAFEAIAYKIDESSIICAVECKRYPKENKEISCEAISSQPIKLLDRKFSLGKIIENKKFSNTLTYNLQDNKFQALVTLVRINKKL